MEASERNMLPVDDLLRQRRGLGSPGAGVRPIGDLVERQLSLGPRQQATVVLGAAHRGRRRVVHPSAPRERDLSATLRVLHDAGADLVCVGSDDRGSEAVAGGGSTPDPVRHGEMTDSPGACSTRLSSADPRSAAEAALAAGATCLVGGPLESLARDSRDTGLDTFDNYRYVDRLVGHLDGEGVRVVRAFSGPRTRAVPPALALAHAFLDAQLAVGQGVRRLAINYPMLGNLVQDVAALQVARSTARRLWPAYGSDVAEVYVSASHWAGEQPTHEGERNAVLASGNIAAATGGADQVLTPAWDVAGGDRSLDGLVGEVRGTRQMLDLLATQELPESEELDEEIADIRSCVDALMEAAPVAGGDGGLGQWVVETIEAGGRVGRDARGAVRWLDAGQLPVPIGVMDRHRYRMEEVGAQGTWAVGEPVARLRMFRSSVDAT